MSTATTILRYPDEKPTQAWLDKAVIAGDVVIETSKPCLSNNYYLVSSAVFAALYELWRQREKHSSIRGLSKTCFRQCVVSCIKTSQDVIDVDVRVLDIFGGTLTTLCVQFCRDSNNKIFVDYKTK